MMSFVKSKLKTDLIPKNIPIKASDIQKPEIKMIGKVIEPSDIEIKLNPRARSAKLRVIERLPNS
jgi:16S rRNA (cytosine1402-N4)-methyltransferase